MTTDKMHLAVWQDCLNCGGTGRDNRTTDGLCSYCHYGKFATYIPVNELANPNSGTDSLGLVSAIKEWMQHHDAAVDELTAELDASGLVPDSDSVPEGIGTKPFQTNYSNHVGTAPSDQELGSGTLPPDAGKDLDLKPSATSMDIGTLAPPDLPAAARHLLDVLTRYHFIGAIKAGKTHLMDAAAALLDALDASPAQVSPDAVKAQGEDGTPCLRCCGTGNVLFWNGTQPCGDCNGSGVQPGKEGKPDD